MKRCNECGREVPDNALFCKHCGHNLGAPGSSLNHFCANCGKQVSADATFCNQCGKKRNRTGNINPVKRPARTVNKAPVQTARRARTVYRAQQAPVPTKSNIGLWIVIALIILVIAAFILMQQYNTAAYERTASGQAQHIANKLFG